MIIVVNGSNITDDQEWVAYYHNISSLLRSIILIIMLVLGTIGNLLTISVMVLRPVGKLGSRFHFTSLAVVDLILLYTGLLRVWLKHLKHFDLRLHADWLCASNVFSVYSSVQLEAWIIVNITIGRFLAVCFPEAGKKWNSMKVAVLTTLGTALAIIIFNCHLLFKRHIITTPQNGVQYCGFENNTSYYAFMIKVYPWLDLIISSLLPISILIPSNIAIIYKIRQSSKISTSTKKRQKVNNVTAMLLTISIVFLISNLPMAILLVVDGIEHVHGIQAKEEISEAVRELIFAVVTILQYVICSCSFYMFCLAAPGFRREFLILFKLKRESNSVQPTVEEIEMKERRKSTVPD